MTSEEPAAQGEAAASGPAGPQPFDTSVAQQARMYDYLLGGRATQAVRPGGEWMGDRCPVGRERGRDAALLPV